MKYVEFMNDLEEEIHSLKPVMVFFYREESDICNILYKKVARLSRKYRGVASYVVDLERHPTAAGEFLAYSVPTLILFFQGKPVYKRSEDIDIPELEQRLQQLSTV
ncbi:MAG: thioredoxin family protein [Spirochaetales bacterium]|nr:thioredoxin family protein [Spirochaetales bacterium]